MNIEPISGLLYQLEPTTEDFVGSRKKPHLIECFKIVIYFTIIYIVSIIVTVNSQILRPIYTAIVTTIHFYRNKWVVKDSMEVFTLCDCDNFISFYTPHHKQRQIAVANYTV